MPAQDTSGIKEKILLLLKNRGPSLPIHIARETGLSILFASAFLSELFSEKKIKISCMKIGSSPLYFLPGQEKMLEPFSSYLKSREKDAFVLLKEKKFLIDSEQEPPIRVALRQIRDFAIPFRRPNTEGLFWRYFTDSESEFSQKKKIEEIKPKQIFKKKEPQEVRELDIFDKSSKEKQQIPERVKKIGKRRTRKKPPKKNDKFFNRVKEHLVRKQIEITDIEEVSKDSLTLKVKENEKEFLLIAYNKRRVGEQEINKAYKKASELGIPYRILCLGEPLKRLENLIKAVKNLQSIEKID